MPEITNKNLARLFFSSQWLIEENAALEALSTYLREEEKVNSGSEYANLGISERRKNQKSVLLSTTGNFMTFSEDNLTSSAGGHIAHVKLTGTMFAEDQLSTRGANSIARDIRIASGSSNVDAILIEVNSGGGQANAAPIIAGAIKDSSKPVIAFVHTAASAAYWAIAGADEIVLSSNISQVGSIGAYMTMNKVMFELLNQVYEEIYSDLSTDKNKFARAYANGDKGPIKSFLNDLVKIFHKEVKSNRSLNEDLQSSTLAGGVFFAKDGIKRGLADSIGTLDQAISRARLWKKKMNKNNTKMDFKQTKLYAFVSKVLGKEVETEEQALEQIQAEFEKSKTNEKALEDLRASIEEQNGKFVSAEEVEASLSSFAEKLKADTKASLDSLKEEIKASNEKATTTISALTQDIASLKGTQSGDTPQGDAALNTGNETQPTTKSKGVKMDFMSKDIKVVNVN